MAKKKRRKGVPSKIFDQNVISTILEWRRRGASTQACASIALISDRTLDYWIRRGKNGEEPYLTFYRKFQSALYEWQAERERIIQETENDWHAQAFLLKHKGPDYPAVKARRKGPKKSKLKVQIVTGDKHE